MALKIMKIDNSSHFQVNRDTKGVYDTIGIGIKCGSSENYMSVLNP